MRADRRQARLDSYVSSLATPEERLYAEHYIRYYRSGGSWPTSSHAWVRELAGNLDDLLAGRAFTLDLKSEVNQAESDHQQETEQGVGVGKNSSTETAEMTERAPEASSLENVLTQAGPVDGRVLVGENRSDAELLFEHLKSLAGLMGQKRVTDVTRHSGGYLVDIADLHPESPFTQLPEDTDVLLELQQPAKLSLIRHPSLPGGWKVSGGEQPLDLPQLVEPPVLLIPQGEVEDTQVEVWLAAEEARNIATAQFKLWVEGEWRHWQKEAEQTDQARDRFGRLLDAQASLERDTDILEVCWGQHFLVSSDSKIRYPLAVVRVSIELDVKSGLLPILRVRSSDLPMVEVDRFDDLTDLARLQVEKLSQMTRETMAPLGDDQWIRFGRTLAGILGAPLDSNGTNWREGVLGYFPASVLFIRQRPSAFGRFFKEAANAASEGTLEIPPALQTVLGVHTPHIETESAPLLLPLPSNEDQESVVSRLRTMPAVTVQGPPGTGKTHTIANLVSDCVARGERVLVTSQRDQALRVVRDKLPSELQALCVTLLDGTDSHTQLQDAVSTLLQKVVGLNKTREKKRVANLQSELEELLLQLRETEQEILRVVKTDHQELALGGLKMTPLEIAAYYEEHKSLVPAIPDTISAELELSVTGDAIRQLIESFAFYTEDDFEDVLRGLPKHSIPPAQKMKAALSAVCETKEKETALAGAVELWKPPVPTSPEPDLDLPDRPAHVPFAEEVFEEPAEPDLPVIPQASEFKKNYHALLCEDILEAKSQLEELDGSGQRFAYALVAAPEREAEVTNIIRVVRPLLKELSTVDDGLDLSTPEISLQEVLAATVRIQEVADANQGKRFMRKVIDKDIARALRNVRLSGKPIQFNDLSMVAAVARAVTAEDLTQRSWKPLRPILDEFYPEPSYETRTDKVRFMRIVLGRCEAALRWVHDVWSPLRERLQALEVAPPSSPTPATLRQLAPQVAEREASAAYASAVKNVTLERVALLNAHAEEIIYKRSSHEVRQSRRRESHRIERERKLAEYELTVREIRREYDGIISRYQALKERLASDAERSQLDPLKAELRIAQDRSIVARRQMEELLKAFDTEGSLSGGLTEKLARALDDRDWDLWERLRERTLRLVEHSRKIRLTLATREELVQTVPRWAALLQVEAPNLEADCVARNFSQLWRAAQARTLLASSPVILTHDLRHRRSDLRKRSSDLTRQLCEASAWLSAAEGLRPEQQSALRGWGELVKRAGKGTGKNAAKWLAEARRAMNLCQDAVPVWVMPLDRAVGTFEGTGPAFDVVIVDESSQCSILGLAAFLLGRKVVVVGDDKQVTPADGFYKQEQLNSLTNRLPESIPNRLLLDHTRSLYDVAAASFPDVVVLREHFRCRPEIISFSSNRYYQQGLFPLREPAHSDELRPLLSIRVKGTGELFGKDLVNRAEIEAIVDFLTVAHSDPSYKGCTFGVVSLLGDRQTLELEQAVRGRFTTEALAARQLKFGSAAQFQGDERDVVCLSFVSTREMTDGVSRRIGTAGDRLEKAVNVAASRARNQLVIFHSADFIREDPRGALVEHCENFRLVSRTQAEEFLNLTESLFEREVVTWLLKSGYEVEPQYPVGRYRLDMVVKDGTRRLAVECDGERWHGLERREGDLRRQDNLEAQGWTFHRIRGAEYFSDRAGSLRRLGEMLTSQGIRPRQTVSGM